MSYAQCIIVHAAAWRVSGGGTPGARHLADPETSPVTAVPFPGVMALENGATMDDVEKVRGAIMGHLVGDALGVPYEFKAAGDLPAEISFTGGGSHGQPPGTYSDDGAMVLCAIASLLEKGGFDPADMARRFVAWMDRGYMAAGGVVFDYGRGTARAISRLRSGVDPLCAGLSGEFDNGNGSLMRIAPVSLWTCAWPLEHQVRASHDCSRITHAHPRSMVSCALYSVLVRRIASGDPPEAAWDAAAGELRRLYSLSGRWETGCASELELIVSFRGASGTGYVVDTLRSALACLFGGDDYPSVARAAVRLGGDTDTTAGVAGALAGLIYGDSSIPLEWKRGLRLDDDARAMLEEFACSCRLA